MSDGRWYGEGLRFQCSGCGDCCTGEPGAVWVNEEEIAELAAYVGKDEVAFEREFVRRKGIRRTLMERFDGDCVFFDKASRGCRVYPARPTQCRTWPFWERNVASPETWQETCEECPGSGEGPLVTVESIVAKVDATRRARTKW